jgi:hypothetical protein
MIQKTNTDYSKTIEGTKLYREDIENILSRLNSVLQKVEIHDSKNIYDNIDDVLSHNGQNPTEISISAQNSDYSLEYFTINIKKERITIYSRGSEKMYALGIEIRELIKSNGIWYYKILNPSNLLFFTFLASISLALFYDKKTKTLNPTWLSWIVIALFLLVFFSYVYRYLWSSLTLVRKHEYGFWNRNKDKIILTSIGLILGSIITILVQLITTHT